MRDSLLKEDYYDTVLNYIQVNEVNGVLFALCHL